MNFFDIFRNKRSVTYREEFQITSKNWNSNRRLVVVFIGILALAQVGLFIKELQIVTLFALVLIVIFGLQQRRINKKRGLGIFSPNSKSKRNIFGWKY